MCSEYGLWRNYLLFTILKRTIQKSEHVEEVASMLGCHPSSYISSSGFFDGNTDKASAEDMQKGVQKIVAQLDRDIPDFSVRQNILEDYCRMDNNHRKVVEKFMTDAFFCDAILSFCGFSSTILLHTKGTSRYPIHTLVSAFNDRALDFFCVQLDPQEVIWFLDICNLEIYSNSVSTSPQEWTYYLAIWAVTHGQCSFWNFE